MVELGRRFMCGKHPNIWMRLKSELGVKLFEYNRVVCGDVYVCPLCMQFARMALSSLVHKTRAGSRYVIRREEA